MAWQPTYDEILLQNLRPGNSYVVKDNRGEYPLMKGVFINNDFQADHVLSKFSVGSFRNNNGEPLGWSFWADGPELPLQPGGRRRIKRTRTNRRRTKQRRRRTSKRRMH
jgi:hypothetical protein